MDIKDKKVNIDLVGATATSMLIVVYEIICQYFEWKKFAEFGDFKDKDILFFWSCKQSAELLITISGIICVYLFAYLSLNWIIWCIIVFFMILSISVYFASYIHIKLKQ